MTTYYYDCYNCGRTVRSEEVDDGKSGFERENSQNCGCADRERQTASEDWDD